MQGAGTDARSDLYSLAATLYHLMTGVLPADALTRAGATIKHEADPLRPAHLAHAQVPAAVGKLIQRAMAQNSALRPASAAQLRAALRQAAGVAPLQVTPRHAQLDATVVGPLAQTPDSPRASRDFLSVAGASLIDSRIDSRSRRPMSETRVARARHAPPAPRLTPTKLVAVAVAVLLVACAAAGLVLVGRNSARADSAEAQANERPAATSDAQALTPAASQPSPAAAQTTGASDAASAAGANDSGAGDESGASNGSAAQALSPVASGGNASAGAKSKTLNANRPVPRDE